MRRALDCPNKKKAGGMSPTSQGRELLRDISYALVGISLAFLVNFSQRILIPALYPEMPSATKIAPSHWKIDLKHLPSGNYFLSAGRATGPCVVLADGTKIATSVAPDGQSLHSVSLSSILEKGPAGPLSAEVVCDKQDGFASGLTDPPVVLSYRPGRMLQGYREFVSIWLGILSALFLTLFLLTLSPALLSGFRLQAKKRYTAQAFNNHALLFSLVALAYGVSLSYIGWTLLSSYTATFLHILVRLLLSWTFIKFGTRFSVAKRPFEVVYLSLFCIYSGAFFSSTASSEVLVSLYRATHFIFGLTTIVLWKDISSSGNTIGPGAIFRSLSFLWAIAQWSDSVSFFLNSPTYNSPVLLTLVAAAIAKTRRAEISLTYQVERVVGRILELSSGRRLPVDSLLKEVSKLIAGETHFQRLSVYIDGYCIGRASQPHRTLVRVHEIGYEKSTEPDNEILLDDERGEQMRQANRAGASVLKQDSTTGAWFCIVPVGSLACINLSDATTAGKQNALNSFSVIQRLQPAIKLLEDRLISANLQRNVFLQRIKALKGFGAWPLHFGVIRVDIEDSSKNTTKYQIMNSGRDVYGEFVHGTYIPALLKSLNGFAELEEQLGDELYLIVAPELNGVTESVEMSTSEALKRFVEFTLIEGRQLCIDAGFEPVTWAGGATVGQGTLICDEFKVRTSGTPANLVKRLQDSAKRGTILIDEKLVPYLNQSKYALGELREYLVKKDRVSARTLYPNITQQRFA
jgi:hypothetical protein